MSVGKTGTGSDSLSDMWHATLLSKPAKLKYVSLQNQNSPNPSPSYSSTNQSMRPKISPKDQPSGGAYVTIDSEKTNEMEGLMTAA